MATAPLGGRLQGLPYWVPGTRWDARVLDITGKE